MQVAAWFRPPRQALSIFLAVAIVSAAALAALTWQLLAQDRDLEGQRRAVQLEQKADALVAAMQEAIGQLESRLETGSSAREALPADVTAISIIGDQLVTSPPARLLYYPAPAIAPLATSSPFAEGERLEFVTGDTAAALAAYARLAETNRKPTERAGALMRLGGVYRKRREWEPALKAYASLQPNLGRLLTMVGCDGRLTAEPSSSTTSSEKSATRGSCSSCRSTGRGLVCSTSA